MSDEEELANVNPRHDVMSMNHFPGTNIDVGQHATGIDWLCAGHDVHAAGADVLGSCGPVDVQRNDANHTEHADCGTRSVPGDRVSQTILTSVVTVRLS